MTTKQGDWIRDTGWVSFMKWGFVGISFGVPAIYLSFVVPFHEFDLVSLLVVVPGAILVGSSITLLMWAKNTRAILLSDKDVVFLTGFTQRVVEWGNIDRVTFNSWTRRAVFWFDQPLRFKTYSIPCLDASPRQARAILESSNCPRIEIPPEVREIIESKP